MVALTSNQPGVPVQSAETFTQTNALWFKAPTLAEYAKTTVDIPVNTLVGRVTGTGLIVPSVQTAADGSQNPVGVASIGVTVDDSNSGLADSNSEVGADVSNISFWKDGVFNYDVIVKDGSWTFDLLKRALDRTTLGVDQIRTASPGTPSES